MVDPNERITPSQQVAAAAAQAPTAQQPADALAVHEPLPLSQRIAPILVLASLLAFVVSSWVGSLPATDPTSKAASYPYSTLFLILLAASFGLWFIMAFTGSPWSMEKRQQCFRFAYSFTITSFIVLMFPFLELWKPDISGPIGLVRGCVRTTAGQSDPIAPRSISCQEPEAVTGGSHSYPWLLTIGGFVGTVVCSKTDVEHPCDPAVLTDRNRYSEISNGLVVPFYVVFLAFIGGAVSLSRRIPEYQKRADDNYDAPSSQPGVSKLKPYEAREVVVFQIMQLVSAPFIAITAYWAIAPSTVSASIGLAFVSGFASETILLLIRGVVDGIRPQTSMFGGEKKPDAPTKEEKAADASSDEVAPSVTVRLAVQADLPVDPGSLALTVDAAPRLLSAEGFVELLLEIGRAHVLVATCRSNGETVRAEKTITPTADDEGRAFSLKLGKPQP